MPATPRDQLADDLMKLARQTPARAEQDLLVVLVEIAWEPAICLGCLGTMLRDLLQGRRSDLRAAPQTLVEVN